MSLTPIKRFCPINHVNHDIKETLAYKEMTRKLPTTNPVHEKLNITNSLL